MANIEDIKKLRDITLCGIGDCKKALEESGGDINKAIEILKKKGAKVASKRAGNKTNEGIVKAYVSDDGIFGFILSLSCETDFVARTDIFVDFVNKVFDIASKNKIKSLDELNNFSIDNSTVNDKLLDLMGKLCENMKLGYVYLTGEKLYCYNHHSNKMSSLVSFKNCSNCHNINDVCKNIAMQVAGMNSIYVSKETIDNDVLREKISEAESNEKVKTTTDPKIKSHIIDGILSKFFQENVLLEQIFLFSDDKKTVKKYLEENGGVLVECFKKVSL